MINYKSDRIFRIWAYTVSHCILILRSPQLFSDVENYTTTLNHNIDVEFWGVSYLELPDTLHGINIRELTENTSEILNKHLFSRWDKIFEISSDEKQFYVVASGCRVGKNNWNSEDRISNSYLEYDEVLTAF